MGNHCGDLAVYSGIATGAEIVISPETGYDEEAILEKLKYMDSTGKNHAIVVVTEKITDVSNLAKKISEFTGFAGRATVLGYIQRGGSTTTNDRVLASRRGEKAVQLNIDGQGGMAVGIRQNLIVADPIEEILAKPRANKKALYRLFDKLV